MSHRPKNAWSYLLAGLTYSVAGLLPVTAYASIEKEWQFTVYLDDSPIGYHEFRLKGEEGDQTMSTRARFDVKFLKIPLFRYRHQNVEQWDDQCLKSIASSTDQNGTLFRVDGATTDNGFQISTNGKNVTLPSCISTFAYWDKSFLQHSQLLNSQTGEYLDVKVEDLGKQTIVVSGRSVEADSYKLNADDLDIELWYSSGGQWLGLQSTTSKGRLLRYVIE